MVSHVEDIPASESVENMNVGVQAKVSTGSFVLRNIVVEILFRVAVEFKRVHATIFVDRERVVGPQTKLHQASLGKVFFIFQKFWRAFLKRSAGVGLLEASATREGTVAFLSSRYRLYVRVARSYGENLVLHVAIESDIRYYRDLGRTVRKHGSYFAKADRDSLVGQNLFMVHN
ncbi:uncharacterized protein BT62DRAFT_1008898 [Guyanagaster necrorhizus]|uniref:Uncharacterized protein n=1 Tax=Guyanagaster necrorhizus TaxID=856835 RepID=A0A9P7VND8_9AGAR|nr:uncharacterized protein BT62DRAFT_1008898 [Guyanagaster necrorhizus MCA 3950]KAG7443822.1 hypothetical protein BT62DRAFT_1008898 [Guyanagaster necrorhizus MCA 3950]